VQGTNHLPKATKSLMKQPLSQLLKLPQSYKQQWLATVEAAKDRFL